jgi:hypothetical protein
MFSMKWAWLNKDTGVQECDATKLNKVVKADNLQINIAA